MFAQGSKPDGFYIIELGEVAILQRKGDEAAVKIATLTDGDYFGRHAYTQTCFVSHHIFHISFFLCFLVSLFPCFLISL